MMKKMGRKTVVMFMVAAVLFLMKPSFVMAENGKVGYVDLRKAFYEYDKTKTMKDSIDDLTEDRQAKRDKMIEAISKLRDEAELLTGSAKEKKMKQINDKSLEIQEFEREARQELLGKENDMFKEVVEDIQKVVEKLGKEDEYDYIFDSRNIMFANEKYELTDQVIKKLNSEK
ncbi:MAG: OmpH family outer membrane protein [Candidatus Omnitrophica bacterium]|nr:OmpH family outer membrane protein [Candidatus Omnitrophota bacterium]